ncbi:hypothetical protein [uncultured Rothia sp.]|uniref:hypothetical protein n=1 Tax=uncultured Rothia sp. TaxID=316088 RepID=UPI00321767F4
MSLFTETLEAYGVDLNKTPVNPAIRIHNKGEREGIIVEQFIKDDTGEYVLSGEELVTGFIFFPEPNNDSGNKETKNEEEPADPPLTLEEIRANPHRPISAKDGRTLNHLGIRLGLSIAKPFAGELSEEELFQEIYGPCRWK